MLHLRGRVIPLRVVEEALERFDHEVGLDQAIAATEQDLRRERDDTWHKISESYRAAQESRPGAEPYEPSMTDELFIERRAHALLLVIARITQYLPEDRDILHELIERASRDKWGE